MIALHTDTVFVIYEDGRRRPFDPRKLARSIGLAASLAGYRQWQLAPHIAAAVAAYLRRDWDQPSVTRDQLFEAVAGALKSVGHSDIERMYRQMHEHAVVDLAALAIEAPSGFELEFFRMLGEQLDKLNARGERRVQFRNLRYCVKILSGKRRWRTRCRSLSGEILAFIRNKCSAASKKDGAFVIAG
jgi:hypothetical protein